MSVRPNAPYEDEVQDNGTVLIYEGHDEPRTASVPAPKRVDQTEFSANGSMTQNGLFHRAAQEYKKTRRSPERVRVYEKLRQGIWSYGPHLGKGCATGLLLSQRNWASAHVKATSRNPRKPKEIAGCVTTGDPT